MLRVLEEFLAYNSSSFDSNTLCSQAHLKSNQVHINHFIEILIYFGAEPPNTIGNTFLDILKTFYLIL